MAGLLAVLIWGLSLLLALGLIVWVFVLVKRRKRRRLPWVLATLVLIFLASAWELIPMWIMGPYYCRTLAGVKVYKTLEQWKAENPGVAETLTWGGNPDRFPPLEKKAEWKSYYRLNERFVEYDKVLSRITSSTPLAEKIIIYVIQYGIADTATGETMASWTYMVSGYNHSTNLVGMILRPLPYLCAYSCAKGDSQKEKTQFFSITHEFQQLGRRID